MKPNKNKNISNFKLKINFKILIFGTYRLSAI